MQEQPIYTQTQLNDQLALVSLQLADSQSKAPITNGRLADTSLPQTRLTKPPEKSTPLFPALDGYKTITAITVGLLYYTTTYYNLLPNSPEVWAFIYSGIGIGASFKVNKIVDALRA